MIFSPILDLPDLNRYGSLKRRTGSGTVLVNPQSQTLTIKTGTEQITAKYLDSCFQSGDSVRYTLLNDMLLIEKMPLPDQTNETDSYTRGQPPELTKISMMFDSLITKISQQFPSDQIKQDAYSILESLSTLSTTADQNLIQSISTLLLKVDDLNSDSAEKLKELFLQLKQSFFNPQPLQSKFIELPLNNIPEAIYKLDAANGLFISSQFAENSLLQDMILKDSNCQYIRIIPCGDKSLAQLISSEDLKYELKSLIENFTSRQLQSLPVSALETAVKSRNELNLEVLKSIDALFTNMKPAHSLRLTGTESTQSSTMTQWLLTSLDHHSILQELASRYPATATSIVSMLKDNPVLMTGIDTFGVTAELINSIDNKTDLIPSIVERLGYNFENKILKSGFNATSQTSLKELILDRFSDSAMGIPQQTQSPDSPFLTVTNMQNRASLSELIDVAFEDVSEFLESLPDIIKSDLDMKKTNKSIHDSLSQMETSEKIIETDLQLNQQINGKKKYEPENSSPLHLNDKTVQLFSNILTDIKTLQNSLSSVRDSISSDLFEHLMNLGEKAGRSIERVLAVNYKTFHASDHASPQSQKTEQRDFPDSKIAFDSTSIKDGLLQNHQQSRTAPDSLLNRFESLQLLSRINSTSDGTQQILAIPMNVGGEWTELNIRLIKKESNNKKKDQKLFKVELNVTPSKLGTINVQMEYEIKKRFNLKIFFGKNQTLEWFSKNRNSLGKSICDLGLPLVNFLIGSEMMKKSENENSKLSSAGIDVKI